MRFLFKALLAATALVPVAAAEAQDGSPDRDRGRRVERSPDGDGLAPRPGRTDGEGRRWNRGQPRPDAGTDAGTGEFRRSPPGQRQWNRDRGDPARPGEISPPPPRIDSGPSVRAQDGRDRPRIDGGRDDRRAIAGREDRFDGRDRYDDRGQARRFDDRDGRGGREGRGYADRGGGGWRNGTQAGGWNGNGGWNSGGRGNDRGDWNRTWRNDQRYDWNRYRTVNRSAYHLPRYYAPSGWNSGYRRFTLGATLGNGLWDQRYWIGDPYAYRLPEAYGPFRWVRYYDDALLVDLRSGRVVDTVYGIFW